MEDARDAVESSTAAGEGRGPKLVADNPGLVASNLGKRFKKRPVVRGVSVSVQRGEAVGLLGPNGAGKTTCFYMITGLISPDYGTISLDGLDVTDMPIYRRARPALSVPGCLAGGPAPSACGSPPISSARRSRSWTAPISFMTAKS